LVPKSIPMLWLHFYRVVLYALNVLIEWLKYVWTSMLKRTCFEIEHYPAPNQHQREWVGLIKFSLKKV